MSTHDNGLQAALAALRKDIGLLPKSEPSMQWVINSTDLICEKFLVGHKLKVKEALKLMIECSKWRYTYRTDSLIDRVDQGLESPQQVRFAKAYLPMGIIGKDLANRPVMMEKLSAIDFPRIIADLGLEKAIEYAIYNQELLQRESTANPLHPGECVVIIDMGIEDLKNPPMTTLMEARAWISGLLKFLQPFSAIVDPFYPEMFFKIFFTRTPAMFGATWNIAKNFIAEATREKIEVLNNKQCTQRLLEFLPMSSIPTFLGGTNEMLGLGRGGKLAKLACMDEKFIESLERDLRMPCPEEAKATTNQHQEGGEEGKIPKRVALDLLRAVIQVELDKSSASNNRGSWRFVPGKDFLENIQDEELETALRQHGFDHEKAFQALLAMSVDKERVKLPGGVGGETSVSQSGEGEEEELVKTEEQKKKGWFRAMFA